MFPFEFNTGVTREQVEQVNVNHSVNHYALVTLLIQKGIITEQEFLAERIKATHTVEQAWTQMQEEARAEFDAEHPGMRAAMKMFGVE